MNSEMLESLKVWSQFGHPLVMWGLFALSLYAMYLGFQARSIRSVEAEVRKELIQKDVRTKHYLMGSILLALMVVGCIGGMGVTYLNNGKLFIGPHLFVGLSMTGIIAIAAALSPLMQKGNEIARYTHIVLNIVLVGLFGWQAVTGMDIVQRIISKL
jgi:nitrate reductase gamma subunit